MKLTGKLLLTYLAAGLLLLLLVGYYVQVRLKQEKFDSIQQNFLAQLYQVDFNLTDFLLGVEYDVLDLVQHETVRTRDDADFTNFLEAEEETFTYNIGPTEQAIIDIFNTYRLNHPYANSVYMGRENGGFVRSHPRARPTQYDPRQRPWYQLALSEPGQVMRTTPYRSVTTPDVNIGTVKALVDENGALYGVVGVDITLRNLTDYIANIHVGETGYIALIDNNGLLLTGPDEEKLFQRYDEAGLDYLQVVMDHNSGYAAFDDASGTHYVFYHTSAELGWKICAVIPAHEIDREVRQFLNHILGIFGAALLLLCALTSLGVHRLIIQPIEALKQSAEAITQTGNLSHRARVGGRDEIGQLAGSVNEMVASIQQAQKELEERTRVAIQHLPVLVKALDQEGTIIEWNEELERATGYQAEEIVGNPQAFEILYPDKQHREHIWVALAEADKEDQFAEMTLTCKDRTEKIIVASISKHHPLRKGATWIVGVDISERKELEEALRQRALELQTQNEELDAFAHTVAHDLKNPLSSVVGYAELLEKAWSELPPQDVEKYLGIIGRSGRKMGNIIEALLLLSQVRNTETVQERLNMADIVDEVRRSLDAQIQEAGAEVTLPASWPIVLGYAPWVEEVWLNYFSNALKYGGRPPRLELGADKASQGMVRFWLRDHGPGIPVEDQARLFAPFTRLSQVRIEGQGLGLSIVQRIVEKLGGEVGVESELGQGSLFYFTLPAYGDPGQE
ncbi:MAG: PAS domain S-box protein [Chloroflexia bacterium]|nr:PAS domain S-box protein [Chloroflexia bacterium]